MIAAHTDSHLVPSPRPVCLECGISMWLVQIEPVKPYHGQQTFRCPSCDAVQTAIVRYDEHL